MAAIFSTSSADWPEQKRLLEEQIAEHHKALETATTMNEVAFLQGKIAQIRWIFEGTEQSKIGGVGHASYNGPARTGR